MSLKTLRGLNRTLGHESDRGFLFFVVGVAPSPLAGGAKDITLSAQEGWGEGGIILPPIALSLPRSGVVTHQLDAPRPERKARKQLTNNIDGNRIFNPVVVFFCQEKSRRRKQLFHLRVFFSPYSLAPHASTSKPLLIREAQNPKPALQILLSGKF